MRNRFLLAAVLLACASALRAEGRVYVIELAPSGKAFSEEAPTLKGDVYTFRRLSDGVLMSLRRSDVKDISEQTRRPHWAEGVTEIANLPMEGGSSTQAGPSHLRTVRGGRASSGQSQGFYGNVAPGATQAMPNSANDYQVGRTYAAPPASAYQSSPGAPPQARPR